MDLKPIKLYLVSSFSNICIKGYIQAEETHISKTTDSMLFTIKTYIYIIIL